MTVRSRGFTLIELMLVVAIIGLLAAIAIPKFADLVVKAKEASTRGQVGTMRSALNIYYADNEGRVVVHPYFLVVGRKYLDALPAWSIATQPDHEPTQLIWAGAVGVFPDWSGPTSTGLGIVPDCCYLGGYYNDLDNSYVVTCTHTDTRGVPWSAY